jgi:hypothetical protein
MVPTWSLPYSFPGDLSSTSHGSAMCLSKPVTLKNLLQFIMDALCWDSMEPAVGDKVRLKDHNSTPVRGVVVAVHDDELLVRLDASGELISVAPAGVTNFSLAARKAWKNMPHRRVGRPKGARHCDRVSVTLRIDRELWEQFRQDEAAGLIADRTAAINAWFRAMLDQLKYTKVHLNATENY